MMELRKEGMIMKKMCKLLSIFCIVVILAMVFLPKKPKLISNITTLDTAYMTILVDWRETGNREKLENKIIQMCKQDSFDGMKLWTNDKERSLRWNISVYSSRKELEKGHSFMTVKYEEGD